MALTFTLNHSMPHGLSLRKEDIIIISFWDIKNVDGYSINVCLGVTIKY